MSKIVISMTSIERRIGTLGWTLDSIYAQTLQPTEVRLYGVSAVVDQEALKAYPQLRRIATEDRGPVTKLSAITDPNLDDQDLIITIDDDIIYEPHWLETLVAGAREHPGAAVGFSGWDTHSFIADPINGRYIFPPGPGPRDVLEGWTGIAYRKSFFVDVSEVMAPPDLFRFVDDVWISWQLQRKGTPRLVLPHQGPIVRGPPAALPGLCNRPDFVKLNRDAAVAAFGSQLHQDIPVRHQDIFTPQYTERSGPGSTVEYTAPYREFISSFIAKNRGSINTVLDLGCGDAIVASNIDWHGAEYLGVDCIEARVRTNRGSYPHLRFECCDLRLVRAGADLVIVKDVLQHWSNADVLDWLRDLSRDRPKFALITNCNYGDTVNSDIATGSWRALDLTIAPFACGEVVFSWRDKDVVMLKYD